MLYKLHDWRPIDTEEDWNSLLAVVNRKHDLTIAMRHQSTKERMDFIRQKQEEEEKFMIGNDGYRPFNPYLTRHMKSIDWTAPCLLGPIRPDEDEIENEGENEKENKRE